jgi:predicted MPP superfamily phosphohydrolase
MDDRTIPSNRLPSWPLLAAALSLLSGSLIAVDAFLVEPDDVEVGHSVEYVPAWNSSAPDLTLVHLSDIHVESVGRRERRAIEAVNSAGADLIVISGDLVRTGSHPEALREFLSALRARRGRFAVFGNHDHDSGIAGTWGPGVVAQSGFTLLENDSRRITTPSGTILIAGIDDPVTGHDSLRRAMMAVARRELSILVAHSPEIVGDLGNWDIDLVLAGHTHGGQVRLPIFGAPLVPAGTRPYVEGWFDVDGGARLHVSRGLGWCGIPIRFLCRPRVDVITLRGGAPPRGRARIATGPA